MKPRYEALSSSRAAGLKRMSSRAMPSATTRARGWVMVMPELLLMVRSHNHGLDRASSKCSAT